MLTTTRARGPAALPTFAVALALGFAAILALMGCTASVPPPDDARGAWLLTEGQGIDGPLALPDAHPVTLEVEESRVIGKAACNHYGGRLTVTDTAWRVDEIGQTEMLCSPAAVMGLEADYLAALQAVTDARVNEETLTLTGSDGVRLVLVRTP